eukprot:3905968-Pyramimonas_sp.AAC.1
MRRGAKVSQRAAGAGATSRAQTSSTIDGCGDNLRTGVSMVYVGDLDYVVGCRDLKGDIKQAGA